jgi:hypothetical protein
MSDFPHDVNTPAGRAEVRESVARGILLRVPLSTEVMAAQLDVNHDDLIYRYGNIYDALYERFDLRDIDLGRTLVERGVLTPLEGLWLDGDDDESYFAGVLAEFCDQELAEELRCKASVIWQLRLWPRHYDGLVNAAHIAETLGCDYGRLVALIRQLPTPEDLYRGVAPPSPRRVLRRYRQLQRPSTSQE